MLLQQVVRLGESAGEVQARCVCLLVQKSLERVVEGVVHRRHVGTEAQGFGKLGIEVRCYFGFVGGGHGGLWVVGYRWWVVSIDKSDNCDSIDNCDNTVRTVCFVITDIIVQID